MKLKSGRKIAGELGVSYEFLIKAARRGRIPCYRVGRSVRFVESEVLEALRG
jgi:excisionase family DNA binding protein